MGYVLADAAVNLDRLAAFDEKLQLPELPFDNDTEPMMSKERTLPVCL